MLTEQDLYCLLRGELSRRYEGNPDQRNHIVGERLDTLSQRGILTVATAELIQPFRQASLGVFYELFQLVNPDLTPFAREINHTFGADVPDGAKLFHIWTNERWERMRENATNAEKSMLTGTVNGLLRCSVQDFGEARTLSITEIMRFRRMGLHSGLFFQLSFRRRSDT